MVRHLKRMKKLKRKNKAPKNGASSSIRAPCAKVWQPGMDKMEEGEELQCDPSAYDCLHAFHVGWPCLSFDVIRDSLGLIRTKFPHSFYCVTGTQAEKDSDNSLSVLKLTKISGKKRIVFPAAIVEGDMDTDGTDDDSTSEDEDAETHGKLGCPVLHVRKVFHEGCVNRIRSMVQQPHICVTWADSGYVQIWDLKLHVQDLVDAEAEISSSCKTHIQSPVVRFGHKDEGYAIDWNPISSGRLLSGDCRSCIYLWEPTSGTWSVDKDPFKGHTASVEDLQWSPTEEHIFASCSVDGNIAIWDIRAAKSPAIFVKAHNVDINVISWNRLASCMIASGSDDGTFSVHDLRLIKADSLVAHFEYHKKPVTSIEWSPHEASTLAVSSADNQLTIWDLSLERDEEEEAEFRNRTKDKVKAPDDLPPQLLFVHQGQRDLKELHWHPHIPGMILSTAADGFNVLMPSNLEMTLPPAAAD